MEETKCCVPVNTKSVARPPCFPNAISASSLSPTMIVRAGSYGYLAVCSSSEPRNAETDSSHFAWTHSSILNSGFPTHTGSLPTANRNDVTVAPAAGNTPSDVAYMFAAMKWQSGEADRYQHAFDSLV